MPFARYLFLHFEDASRARNLDRPPASRRHHRPALGPRQAAKHRQHRLHPQRTRQPRSSPCHSAQLSCRIPAGHEEPAVASSATPASTPPSTGTASGTTATSTPGSESTQYRRALESRTEIQQSRSRNTAASNSSTRRTRQPSWTDGKRPRARTLRLHRRLWQPRLPRRLPQHPARPGQARRRRQNMGPARHRRTPAWLCR